VARDSKRQFANLNHVQGSTIDPQRPIPASFGTGTEEANNRDGLFKADADPL